MRPAPGYNQESKSGNKPEKKPATVKADVIVRKEFDSEGGVIYDNIVKDPKHNLLLAQTANEEENQKEHHHHEEETSQSTTQETIKTEETTQETKPEEPKPEEPKPEEPKTEEHKAEEIKEPEPVEKPQEKPAEQSDVKIEVVDTGAKQHPGSTLLTGEYLKGIDMKTFLMSPAPKGYLLQCAIKREKGGLLSHSKYFLRLEHEPIYLLGAKKQGGNKTSNYAVSMSEKDFGKKAPGYLGKVRANFLGTEFNFWDHGANPKKASSPANIREQLGAVLYEANVVGFKGPRKMKVLLPEIKPDGEVAHFKPVSGKEGMVADYHAKKIEGFKVFTNKLPKWNEKTQSFVLNFHGRVQKASVKNFQLVEEGDEEKVLLQFGRTDDTHFIMDFQWPLSPFQAFSICLTSFDYKIACE